MNNGPANTVGEYIRSARESKKLSLDEVNRHTKISVQVLEAIEQDDLEAFESDIYLKGFLKNYAAFLDLDVEQVMRTLERQRGRADTGKGTLWDIEETVTEERLKSPSIMRRYILPAMVIIIIVLAVLFIRERGRRLKELKADRTQGYIMVETTDARAT